MQKHGRSPKDQEAALSNKYFVLDRAVIEVDISQPHDFRWGIDYHLDMLKLLEDEHGLDGYTFYLSYITPESLPAYGEKVVLIVTGDEFFSHRSYFNDIHCVLRCYPRVPVYLDGFPNTRLRISALSHFIYKRIGYYKSVWRTFRATGRSGLKAARQRTFLLPLGLFRPFEPETIPILEREFDVAFMGSVNFEEKQQKRLTKIIAHPKVLARNLMADSLRKLGPGVNVYTETLQAFEQSVWKDSNQDYVDTIANTKISLVPRGTLHETYRFFESCKAGCVVICERLPKAWCYQNHPGILIEDWSDLPEIVEALLADDALMKRKSLEAYEYWQQYCSPSASSARVAEFIRKLPPLRRQPAGPRGEEILV